MSSRGRWWIRRAILGLLVVSSSWLTLSAGTESGVEQGDPTLAAELTEALGESLSGEGSWNDLKLVLGCLQDERFQTLEVFGRGIGIWNDEAQFELPAEMMRELLTALRAADFAWMNESYGGRDRSAAPVGLTGEADAAVKVVCRLSVALGGVEKTVSQLFRGEQHQPLQDLAAELFEIVAAAAAEGVRSANLGEALSRLSTGDLAPETLRLLLIRSGGERGGDGSGWMLRIEGPEAWVRPYEADGGLGEKRELTLTDEEVADLAEMLSVAAFDALPQYLYAETYTDFTVKVLAREHEIEARRYGGVESEGEREARRRFEGIVQAVEPLIQRALASSR